MTNWIKVENDVPAVKEGMTNWTKVENDVPAVLRALADGKRVRWHNWGANEFARLHPDGQFRDELGNSIRGLDFPGTWYIESPRDIATDPQVGDEFIWDGERAKVVAMADGFVFFHDGECAIGYTSEEWASTFKSGIFKRIEDEQ